MRELLYNEQTIQIPSELMVERLRTLLPYWGMELQDNHLIPALLHKSVTITGLEEQYMKEVTTHLAHTGIEVASDPLHLHIHVRLSEANQSPIILKDEKMTYHLKPSHMQNSTVQKFIHKNIWLPYTSTTIQLIIHPDILKHIPEYISYLCIQYFMKDKFQPLQFPFTHYEQLVQHVLTNINSSFAHTQRLYKKRKNEWPTPPRSKQIQKKKTHKQLEQNEPSASHQPKISTENFSPFRSNADQEEITINPFKYRSDEDNSSPIEPFRKK